MIPKIIHYCWFGKDKKNKLAKKCIQSWKKYCPEYRIIEWNEENFDINMNKYTKYCYDEKKYAFLSDYVRLLVVYQYGGIYLDTDVEVIKSFDTLLNNKMYLGFEDNNHINTGHGFGAEEGHTVVKAMIDEYSELLNGTSGTIGCPILNTNALVKLGMRLNGKEQIMETAVIFAEDYFNPYDDSTGKINKTCNTYSIHWYAKSWLSSKMIIRSKITKPFHRIFGVDCFKFFKKKN